ncbi:unnamed protein product [Closterium sp. Naga37s-1]|nr:unnamed protein product [Closterium sp. Naga37s-1]
MMHHSAVCCRDGSVLQGWQCAAGMAVCCRDGMPLFCLLGMLLLPRPLVSPASPSCLSCLALLSLCTLLIPLHFPPSFSFSFPRSLRPPLASGAAGNFLIGSVPALAPGVVRLDLRNNYLTDMPSAAYQWCGGTSNCLVAPTKCTTSSTAQRPVAECAICGTTNGIGPICPATGGVCAMSATANVASGAANTLSPASLRMYCLFPPPPIKDSAAMLALKASLGITLTTWDGTVPCKVVGQTTMATVWTGVLCDMTGTYRMAVSFFCSAPLSPLPRSLVVCAHPSSGLLPPLAALSRGLGSSVVCNYLIGTVPALSAGLLTLDLQLNFLTDLPAAAYLWCGATSNCLVTPSKCATLSTVQRPLADCAFCGTTNGVAPFCSAEGGVCSVDASTAVAAGSVNGPSTTPVPWICVGVKVAFMKDATAMLALKSSLGVTQTTWASTSSLCTVQGKSTTYTTWARVFCDTTGTVVSINMYSNLLFYRLDAFTTHLRSLPALADIVLQGWHAIFLSLGDVAPASPSCLSCLALLSLCTLLIPLHFPPSFSFSFPRSLRPPLASGAAGNFLMGSVPALAPGVVRLDLRNNYLTDMPSAAYQWCGGTSNCLVAPTKCTTSSTAQRPVAECAICGTTNGIGPICPATGGVCAMSATANVASGAANTLSPASLRMYCLFPPPPIKDSAAMLALKASLGITLTTWDGTVPCKVAGQTTMATVWTGVLCDMTGAVVSIAPLSPLPRSLVVCAHPSSGLLPPLAALSRGLGSSVVCNYLIGTVPALSAGLLTLDLQLNFLTDLPAAAYLWCGATSNCLVTPSKCATLSTVQRPLADCAFCGTTNGVAPFCSAEGGVCSVDASTAVAAGSVNGPSTTPVPWISVGVKVAFMKDATGAQGGVGTYSTGNVDACSIRAYEKRGCHGVAALSDERGGCPLGLWCPLGGCGAPVVPLGLLGLPPHPASTCPCAPCPSPTPPAARLAVHFPAPFPACPLQPCWPSSPRWASLKPRGHPPLRSARSRGRAPPTQPGLASSVTPLALSNMYSNLLFYRLDAFTTHLRSLPALADIVLQGWHAIFLSLGDVAPASPSCLSCLALLSLCTLLIPLHFPPSFSFSFPRSLRPPLASGAAGNFLMGSVPALAPGVVRLDLRNNYLTDMPSAAYQWCGGTSNCLVAPTKCTTSSTAQRPVAECAICGTTNGIGPICPATGGVCAMSATANVASGAANTLSPASLRMYCLFPPPPIKDSAAMLALKASLGITLTTWDGTVPCKVVGQTTMATVWTGVLCDMTGTYRMAVSFFCSAPLSPLPRSLVVCAHPSSGLLHPLAALSRGLGSSVVCNYLIGTVPALSAGLLTLDLQLNFLTDLPAAAYLWCGATSNCLVTPSKCATLSTVQRPLADCAFCGTTNGVAPFCSAEGGVCSVDASTAVAAGSVNGPSTTPVPWICVGVKVAFMKDATGAQGGVGTYSTGNVDACSIRAYEKRGCHGVAALSDERGGCPLGLWCPLGGCGAPWAPWPSPAPCLHLPMRSLPLPHSSRCSPGCPFPRAFPRVSPAAMLALKSSLGVTQTTWASTSSLCTVQGKSTTYTTWARVFCDTTGTVVSM